MSTDSNHAVVKLSLSSQGPSFQHPRFGFSNTLSAIKHNDSVGRGGGRALRLTLYPSLFLRENERRKHLQAIRVSTNLSVDIILLPLAPSASVQSLHAKTLRRWRWKGEAQPRRTHVPIRQDTEEEFMSDQAQQSRCHIREERNVWPSPGGSNGSKFASVRARLKPVWWSDNLAKEVSVRWLLIF